MRTVITILLSAGFLTAGISSHAQQSRPYVIGSRIHAGMQLPLYEALSYLNREDIYAFDLYAGLPSTGKSYWESLYRYPEQGIGLSSWSLGNDRILGRAYNIYHYLNLPLIRKNSFSLNYQVSFGGSYITRKFDRYENPLNRAIGSHFNIYMRLGLDAKLSISGKTDLVVEAGATHFSNGKTRSPNYGINAGSVSAGVSHRFGGDPATAQIPEIPGIEKKYIQSFVVAAGSKVYDNLSGKKYLASSVSYSVERQISIRRKAGIGADLFYDASIGEALAVEKGLNDTGFRHLVRAGVHASYYTRYKQLLMGVQAGYYLYSKYIVLTPVYTRLSLQYLVSDNIFGSVAVKSHLGKADCLEWGIGYCW